MKKLLGIMLCLCMLLGVAAVGYADAAKEEVIFWGYWDGDVAAQINEIVTDFNAQTGNNVKYVPQADMMNTFQAGAIAGDVPDVMLWDASEVRRYAGMGQLLAVQDYLAEKSIPQTDFNDESIRELTVNSALFGLPMNLDIWGLYVNMDILGKAGITAPPSTWDEVKAAAVAAMKVEGVKTGLNMKFAPYLFNSFLVANAGQPLSEDGKTVNLDDKALQVLNYFKELVDAGVYTTSYAPEKGADGFLTGEEAMVFWPTSMLRTYKTYGDQMNFTFMPIPQGRAEGAKAGGTQTSWSLVIPAAAKHADVAKDFIAFALHNNENSLKWCNIVGGFSALKAVQNDPQFSGDKYLKNIIAGIGNLKIRSDVPGFINLEGTCYGPEIQKMYEGSQTPEQTLTVMTTEGNKLLAQYRGE